MPAIFRARNRHINTGVTDFSQTMSFAFSIKPDTAEVPNFFSVGFGVFSCLTNTGDFNIVYDITEGNAQIHVVIVHAGDVFCSWQFEVPLNAGIVQHYSIDMNIVGTTRSASDVVLRYNGVVVPILSTSGLTGTLTPPTSVSSAWTIGGTSETGTETRNGFRGMIGQVSAHTTVLTAAQHATINKLRNRETISGTVLYAPLTGSLYNRGTGSSMMTWQDAVMLSGGLITPSFYPTVDAAFLDIISTSAGSPPTPPSGPGNQVIIGTVVGNRVGTYIN